MYSPAEDSFLLTEQIKKYLKKEKSKDLKILDMGTGSAIQALTCKSLGFNNILCVDIDKEALNHAKDLGLKALRSNLFEKINKKEKFELILFNPPYLPEHKYDKEKDTSGGKKGDETILKLLKQARSHLSESGKILLLLSSLTPRKRINSLIKKLNFKVNKLAEKKLFFELLEVWLISY